MKNDIQEYSFRKEHKETGFEISRLDTFFENIPLASRKLAHRVKFYVILFINEGNGKHQINFKTYPYQEKNILFIGKDQIHAWGDDNDVNGFVLFFTEEFLYQNQIKFKDLSYSYPYNSLIYKPIISLQQGAEYNTFHALVKYIYQEYTAPNRLEKQEILQCLLRTFILKIKSQSKDDLPNIQSADKALFIQFQRMLDKELVLSRNATDYCNWLNVSYRKLNKICKIFTNLSIKSFIDKTLILKAKKELSDKTKNITEVSYLVGFDEVTNFTKYFKKHTSLSPKAFRNSIF